MGRLKCTKTICYLNFIFLIIFVTFTIINSKTNAFLPLLVYSTTSHSINSSFQNERINQLLASYSYVYEKALDECDTTYSLTDYQQDVFHRKSNQLIKLRTQIVPYPNEYFHGRGIVLTTGSAQLKFARVNLKMLEKTGTRLPVQVIFIILYFYFDKNNFFKLKLMT